MASTLANLLYHIIFSTKGRLSMITPNLQPDLHAYIGGIIRGERGIPIEIGGIYDHVHIVARFRPDVSISDMVRTIKSGSSKWVNEKPGSRTSFNWQTGYAAFTVSASRLPTLREYVRNQPDHHRTKTFQEEFLSFLKKNEITYDPRFLWK